MKFELYTKDNCNYCTRSKFLLIENNISFQEYKLGKDFTREILLSKFPSAKSFPVIVIDGFYIGGYTELNEHISLNHANSTEVFLTE